MSDNFLNKLSKSKENEKLVESVHEDVEKIKEIRIKIGNIINTYIYDKNKTKKEIFEILSQDKTIKTSQLKSMIDEAYFQKKYSPSIKLEFQEIKRLQYFFRKNKISEEKRKEILKSDIKIYDILDNIEEEKENKKTTRHVLEFDEETEELFKQSLLIVNKIAGSKLNMTLGVKMILEDFISSYPYMEEQEENIDF